MPSTEECPRCRSTAQVRQKLLLIDPFNAKHFEHYPNHRASCPCQGDLSVDGLRPELVEWGTTQQFVTGCFCEGCGHAFVPEHYLKPAKTAWKLTREGWHRVNADGTLGPPQLTADPD